MARPRTGSAFPHGGHFDIRITLPDGSRSKPRCMPATMSGDQARAEALRLTLLAEKLGAVRAGVSPTATGPAFTIGDVVERWCPLIEAGELAPATRSQHVQLARGPITARFGKLAPRELTTAALRVWLRELKARLSPSRTRHHFFTLAKMLDDAAAEGWIDDPNPCRHAKVKQELPQLVAPEDDEKAHHTEAEALALIEGTSTPVRRMRYAVAFTTGMRDGEIAGLRWGDLAEEKGVLVYRIRGAVARCGDEGWATRRATKTPASRRMVPVHPGVVAMLEAWKGQGWEAYVGRASKADDPLFPGPDGLPVRPDSSRLLRLDLEAAGLPVSFEGGALYEFRSTRRSFATWLEAHGVSGETIDRLLGHAGVSVRRKHYAAANLEALARAVALIACVPSFVRVSSEGVTKRPCSVPFRGNGEGDAETAERPAQTTMNALLKTGAGASLASASMSETIGVCVKGPAVCGASRDGK